jgi:hypothetical protein
MASQTVNIQRGPNTVRGAMKTFVQFAYFGTIIAAFPREVLSGTVGTAAKSFVYYIEYKNQWEPRPVEPQQNQSSCRTVPKAFKDNYVKMCIQLKT